MPERNVEQRAPSRRGGKTARTGPKVRITWNGAGGELDAITVRNDSEDALTKALIRLLREQVVSPGDSFTIEQIKA